MPRSDWQPAFREGSRRAEERLFYFFCVAKRFQLLFQLFLFARVQVGLVQALQLEAQKLLVVAALLGLGFQFVPFGHGPAVVVVEVAIVVELLCVAGHGVERVEQERLVVEQQVLVLRVDVDQVAAGLFEYSHGHGRVVDECAAFSPGVHLAAYDALVAVKVDVVFRKEGFQIQSAGIECRFHATFLRSGLDGLCVGPLSEQQAQSAQDDALAGARLARDDGKALRKVDIQPAYECVIADMQVLKHSLKFLIP